MEASQAKGSGQELLPVAAQLQTIPFTSLPPQIRRMIYDIHFQEEVFELCWVHKKNSGVKYRPTHKVYSNGPILAQDTIRRRRALDLKNRFKQQKKNYAYEPQPGPCAFLITCKLIQQEATPIFYRLATFQSNSSGVLNAFLNCMGNGKQLAKANIRSLVLRQTISKEFPSEGRFKAAPNNTPPNLAFNTVCKRLARDLTGLRSLEMDLIDRGKGFNAEELDTKWLTGILAFTNVHLTRATIQVNVNGLSKQEMSAVNHELSTFLLKSPGLVETARQMIWCALFESVAPWLAGELRKNMLFWGGVDRPGRDQLVASLLEHLLEEEGH